MTASSLSLGDAFVRSTRMNPRVTQLANSLKTDGCRSLYLITGEEEWLVKEATTLIENTGLAGGLPEFNQDRYSLTDTSMADVLSTACTLPMMGAKRVVTVHAGAGLDADASKELLAYVENVVPTTVLIVVSSKVDARQKVVKALKKIGEHLAFEPFKGRDAVSWVIGEAEKRAFGIDYDAAALLVEDVGTELRALATNIEKLVAFVGEERPISKADVLAAVNRTREEVIWDLTDSVGAGNWKTALITLRGLLVSGQSPILVVAMLARHLRQIWMVKSMLEDGDSPDAIAKKARLHPYVAKKLSGQAHGFRIDTLREGMILLFEADRDLKSSRLDGGTIVEMVILQLCGGKSVDRR